MKKMVFIALCVAIFASLAMAQVTYAPNTVGGIGRTSPVDKLGAHNNGGRGCAGCHAPHSGARGNGGSSVTYTGTNPTDPNMGNDALWGQDLTPLYGYTLNMGDKGQYVETLPTEASFAVGDEEIRGIMMCLSCHDGNIAKGAMMTGQSWEQAKGLLPANAYGTSFNIPTLLGNDGTAAGNYNNDHPVGQQATLGALKVDTRFSVTVCNPGPQQFWCLNTGDAQYLEFMQNYGAFQLIPGRASFIVIPTSNPTPAAAYVVCTTCHTPHSMYTYKAGTSTGQKVGLGSSYDTSGVYPTYFFINAPYNPGAAPAVNQASSATQFCRQCHFSGAGGSNEASSIHGVTTQY